MNRRCFMGYSMPGDSNKVLSPVKINEMRDVVNERNWTAHYRGATSFHELAGMSQVCFSFSVCSFLPVDSLHSSRAASVAILPSALLVERFSLGAWWAFPIQ